MALPQPQLRSRLGSQPVHRSRSPIPYLRSELAPQSQTLERKTRRTPVTPLRSADAIPAWFLHINWWRQTTTGLAIISCLSVLGLYSWTVYTQQRWNKQYDVFQQLRRNDRQYQLMQESFANSLRDQAKRSEMVPLVPERMIEVPVAKSTPTARPQTPVIRASGETFYPAGY